MEPEKEEQHKTQTESKIITHQTAQELDSVFDDKESEAEEKVEAALFISARFLSLQELIMLTDINPIMLKEILHKLEKKHSQGTGKGAIRIIHKENNWKMDVVEKYHYMINKLATGNTEFTRAEQETLAILAYKQPIKQSVVIKIRGNKAYDHIKKFTELGLVMSKRLGHTKELRLSDDFYDYFHIQKSPLESKKQQNLLSKDNPTNENIEQDNNKT